MGWTARRLRDAGAVLALAGFLVGWLAVPLPAPHGPYSTVVLDSGGRLLQAFLSSDDQWYFPPDPSQAVPSRLRQAVIRAEDRRFETHPGFDPLAMGRALAQYLGKGRVVSGASTLTMQVARILHPKPRTLPSKALEVLEAIKLESRYTKTQILGLYLDHAPYGGNVIGYRAASLRYFGKSPDALTWAECATLAALPRSPGRATLQREADAVRGVRDRILADLARDGIIDGTTLEASLAEPLPDPDEAGALKREAPHFSRRLAAESGPGTIVRTTLDLDLQHAVEAALRGHRHYLELLGIHNAAVLVAETGSGKVRAWVGSQDFDDPSTGGQVDGVTARRSSGSILKPFLYALAMDAGLILPQTMIEDVPSHFGTFQPQNIGFTYTGLVAARDALVRSLNVPAVRLLERYGHRAFYRFLLDAGFTTLFRAPDDYGLTLILGGAESTLFDLVRLYRGLGRGGLFEPLVLREDATDAAAAPGGTTRLVSAGATALTLQMLRELKRPGLEAWWQSFSSSRELAWKTGTSYGNRDAWALGVEPTWTIGVWVGNFSGESNPNLLSSAVSAPLLFDVLASLPRPSTGWFETDASALRLEKVCLDTGYLAGPYCPTPAWVPAPAASASLEVCPYHRRIHVTLDGRWQVSSLCWTEGDHREATVLEYPPDVAQYLREQGRPLPVVPPWMPGCPVEGQGGELSLVYPTDGINLVVPREMGGDRQVVTARAAHQAESERIYWYLDDVYLGVTTRRHAMPLDLAAGEHVLVIIDGRGKSARAAFRSGLGG